MSESIQLEQLLNEKSSVEDEGHELDEEQKQLKLRAKVLTEKIIQELKKKNNAKHNTVNDLQSTVSELENQLNSLTISSIENTNEPTENNEETNEINQTFEESPQEITDDTVSVTEVAEELEVGMDPKDRKKRKFF